MSAAAGRRPRLARVRSRLGALRPRETVALLMPGPRLRRWGAVVLLVAVLLGAFYMAWLRDAPFFAVERVTVTGASGKQAGAVRTALEQAGADMTTLHVDRDQLSEAVAGFPSVRSLEVSSAPPHELEIRVLEHRPIALLTKAGDRLPIAADGSVLAGMSAPKGLPEIAARGELPDERLGPGPAIDAARLAGAAPPELLARVQSFETEGAKGVVAQLTDDGPDIYLGSPSRAAEKWRAVARVLADESSTGATYVDVRLPERPVAGGLPVQPGAAIDSVQDGAVAPAPTDGTAATEDPTAGADTGATSPDTAGTDVAPAGEEQSPVPPAAPVAPAPQPNPTQAQP